MNEWMTHLYSALLCIAVHPKHFTIMCVCVGGGLSSIHHKWYKYYYFYCIFDQVNAALVHIRDLINCKW